MTATTHNYVFVNADTDRTPVHLKVGDEMVLVRRSHTDDRTLWPLFSMVELMPVGFSLLSKLPGQPEDHYIVEILKATRAGKGKIVLRFSAPGPGVNLLPEEAIPFVIED